MFTTAFDAAGTDHDQELLIVAGFISTADHWINFDRLWRKRLADDGLKYFHMVDFASFKKQFRNGWRDNEPRRRALLGDLMDIIQAHAFRRFGCVVENTTFLENVSKDVRDQYFLDAYTAASLSCTQQVRQWCTDDGSPKFETIRFVFEAGDKGQTQLEKRFRNDLKMIANFEFKFDQETHLAFTPLQAADFLAYELFLGVKETRGRKHNPRWALLQFLQMPGRLGIMNAGNLQIMVAGHEGMMESEEWFRKIYGKKS
jgi:hypothetical protein